MEKTCETCRRSAMCNHSGSVCRNWREQKMEPRKVTPEELEEMTRQEEEEDGE